MTTHSSVTLDEAQLAAIARVHFGLMPLSAAGLEDDAVLLDAEGVQIGSVVAGRLDLRESLPWPTPQQVRDELDRRGWRDVQAVFGMQPTVDALPVPTLALVPVVGRPDDLRVLEALRGWRLLERASENLLVVPVPIPISEPPAAVVAASHAYGAARCHILEVAPVTSGGLTVFFTGLSGAGKSTIARALLELLPLHTDRMLTLLDGDVVRTHLSRGLGFSREDRDINVLRIGWVASEITKHGGIVVCAPIAPYAATRHAVRQMVEEQGGPGSFVLVHVATPLEQCEVRDRKGLYVRARRGEVTSFTGVSDVYEVPDDAEVSVTTTGSVADSAAHVLAALLRRGLLERPGGRHGEAVAESCSQ